MLGRDFLPARRYLSTRMSVMRGRRKPKIVQQNRTGSLDSIQVSVRRRWRSTLPRREGLRAPGKGYRVMVSPVFT